MDKPVLWHIPISHFSEKARWALAYKGVEHERRSPPPGVHMLVSMAITRGKGKTVPVLQMDGETIADSTEIIRALDERYPDPPLIPSSPAERERALELEDFFDEELGPHIRLYAYNELMRDPEGLNEVARKLVPSPLRPVAGPFASTFVKVRFGAGDDDRAQVAKAKVVEALDRIEAELGEGDYLAGDFFSVADLTAAALLYPLVTPPEGPRVEVSTPRFEEFRAPLRERRAYRWVEDMFARHRKPAVATPA
jgi:glutathione S-transferase